MSDPTEIIVPASRAARGRPGNGDTSEPDARNQRAPLAREAASPVDEDMLSEFLSTATIATRRPTETLVDGDFEIPRAVYARFAGFDFQWMTVKVFNEPVDPGDLVRYAEAGWKALPGKLAPEMLPNGIDMATVDRAGSRLFVRPMALSIAARNELTDKANEQKQARMAAALAGDPGPLKRVTTDYSNERVISMPDAVKEV